MKKKLTKKLKNNGTLVQLYAFEATGGAIIIAPIMEIAVVMANVAAILRRLKNKL